MLGNYGYVETLKTLMLTGLARLPILSSTVVNAPTYVRTAGPHCSSAPATSLFTVHTYIHTYVRIYVQYVRKCVHMYVRMYVAYVSVAVSLTLLLGRTLMYPVCDRRMYVCTYVRVYVLCIYIRIAPFLLVCACCCSLQSPPRGRWHR